jgi:diguanylate cyclase (GGDEF)-like protein
MQGSPSGSLVFLPLTIEERVIGILTLQSYRKNAYLPRDRVLLEALGPYVGIAMENSLIHDRLTGLNRDILGEKAELEKNTLRITHLANHDSLTGLPNRRLLFELLQKSFDIAGRSGTRVGVIYVDLDDFKPINDRLGHAAGDEVLVEMAGRLRGMMRSSDTVSRIGGDEFVVVLTNIKERSDMDTTVAKILDECTRPLPVGKDCKVGLSMGTAVFPDDGRGVEEILSRADAAMYEVKYAHKKATRPESRSGKPGRETPTGKEARGARR